MTRPESRSNPEAAWGKPVPLGQIVCRDTNGWQVSASPRVSAASQRAFFREIVFRLWDDHSQPAPGSRFAYLLEPESGGTLFGWLYSDPPAERPTPLFICYVLDRAPTFEQLESIFLFLQLGPLPPGEGSPTDLTVPDLWSHRPLRPGVAATEAQQAQARASLARHERLKLLLVAPLNAEHRVAHPGPEPEEGEAANDPPSFSPQVIAALVGLVALLLVTALAFLLNTPGSTESGPTDIAPRPQQRPADPTAPAPSQTVVGSQPQQPPADSPSPTLRPSRGADPSSAPQQPSTAPRFSPTPTQARAGAVPVLPTGTSEQKLVERLGQPTSRRRGYWPNTEALLYRVEPGRVDLGFVIDRDSRRIRQTEAGFDQSIAVARVRRTLAGMVGGELPATLAHGLDGVRTGRIRRFPFRSGPLEGVIERTRTGQIYLGVWEADLH